MIRRLLSSRRVALAAVTAVAVVFWLVYSYPPSRIANNVVLSDDHIVRGAVHVHSQRSDGGGTIEDIAEAARAVGLDFVVVTDHGDGTVGTRARYYDGVLLVEGVEISTRGGHYIAVGHSPAAYPLGGDAKGVVEDVRRHGGVGIVAHPNSSNEGLRWENLALPVDGVEWLNGDSQWRVSEFLAFAKAATWYWLKPTESLGMLLTRPAETMDQWLNRKVFGVGGVDAHARLMVFGDGQHAGGGLALSMPSYQTMFGLFGVRVSLDEPFSGLADDDLGVLLDGFKKARSYIVVDAYGEPGTFEFFGERRDSNELVKMGDEVEKDVVSTLTARVESGADVVIRLLRDGDAIEESHSSELNYNGLDYELGEEGNGRASSYWIEVFRSDVPSMPWIISNPIYVEGENDLVAEAGNGSVYDNAATLFLNSWSVERSADAVASGISRDGGFVMDYELGESGSTYVAAAHDVSGGINEAVVRLFIATDKPSRVSLQLRDNDGIDRRWRTSFYVNEELKGIDIPIKEFSPVTDELPKTVPVDEIDDLLVVVDRVNARANSSGSIRIGTVATDVGPTN